MPERDWEEWRVGQPPNGLWATVENRQRYMRWLGQELGFKQAVDWFRVTALDFKRNFGGGLLSSVYEGSPAAAVQEFLPEHDWKPWLFSGAPKHVWRSLAIRRQYMQWQVTWLIMPTHLIFKPVLKIG